MLGIIGQSLSCETISKIFERLVYEQVEEYLIRHDMSSSLVLELHTTLTYYILCGVSARLNLSCLLVKVCEIKNVKSDVLWV